MSADVVDTAQIRALYGEALPGWCVESLCDALDLARDRNAELMNDRTEALNGEALQRGRAHAAEARIANALDAISDLETYGTPFPPSMAYVRSALTGPTP